MHEIDYDIEYNNAIDKMANGGTLEGIFKINTPTGVPSKLTYIQQLLVRTKAFKEWFGDWENFAKLIVESRAKETPVSKIEETILKTFRQNDRSFGNLSMNQLVYPFYFQEFKIEDVSYTIDYDTLEPQAYWHGTKSEEFYEFRTEVSKLGRPYAYFAVNKLYSEKFSEGNTLYSVFTCIKNPYINFNFKEDKALAFLSNIFIDYSIKKGYDANQTKQVALDPKYNYIKERLFNVFGNDENILFWKIMATDYQGLFKKFLQELGYDGIMYIEEYVYNPELFKEDEITRAVTIFEPNQVKLADGRNTEFSALNNDIRYEKGGLIAPNGKKSNLTPEQYKLVRTPEFKKWFGDWENDPENSSKVVDENGEPLVVYHGTYAKEPFYTFDLEKADLGFHFGTKEQAKNRSTAKLFREGFKSYVSSYFLNIKTLFEVSDIGEWEYPQRYIDMLISDNIIDEKIAKQKGFFNAIYREDNLKIREYIKSKYGDSVGFIYNNKHEGDGKSFIVLSPNQIKLADGTNTTFNSESDDIRYAEGGKTKMNRYSHLHGMIGQEMPKFAEGGSVSTEHGLTNSGKKGGYFEGRSHAEGGIKAWNTTTNSPLEVEGGEVIITKKAVDDDELHEFEGEMLTNKQILSKINESGGGVKFEDGGEIHQCNCSGKMYKFGGETLEDYQIMNRINSKYNKKHEMKNHKINYGHNLMKKMKEGGYC